MNQKQEPTNTNHQIKSWVHSLEPDAATVPDGAAPCGRVELVAGTLEGHPAAGGFLWRHGGSTLLH